MRAILRAAWELAVGAACLIPIAVALTWPQVFTKKRKETPIAG